MTSDSRALDLLTQHVTEGLDGAGTMELRRRLEASADYEMRSFAFAAAACELAAGGIEREMPSDVRLRARDALLTAVRDERANASAPVSHPSSPSIQVDALAPIGTTNHHAAASRTRRADRIGWLIAAAALALAVIGWWPHASDWSADAGTRAEPGMRRGQLLATADDAINLPWQATEDPAAAGARGDVVWSGDRQVGFMRFEGLEANDPSDFQYQLWIFDAARDERYPIDGGVFDIGPDGEVVIPISATLQVESPTLFAVTVEPPGGVVVSSRERIVLLAQVG